MTTSGPKLSAEQVIAALRETNGNMALAARKLKVTRQGVKYYVDNFPTVRAAHDEAAAYVSDIAEGHLVAAVMKGNLDQARYWLENKARDRGYGRNHHSTVEVTGKDGGPIQTVFSHSAAVAALAARSGGYSDAPGTDEGGRDGETLG